MSDVRVEGSRTVAAICRPSGESRNRPTPAVAPELKNASPTAPSGRPLRATHERVDGALLAVPYAAVPASGAQRVALRQKKVFVARFWAIGTGWPDVFNRAASKGCAKRLPSRSKRRCPADDSAEEGA